MFSQVKETAEKMRKLFKYEERDNGFKGYVFTDEALKGELRESISPAIHESGVGENFSYESVVRSLEIIGDSDNEDEAENSFMEEEAPCYTSDLTGWLAA